MSEAHLFVIGVSHNQAPVEIRERLAPASHEALRADLAAVAGLREFAVLSTCNRIEFYGVGADGGAADSVQAAYCARQNFGPAEFERIRYRLSGRDAALHLFLRPRLRTNVDLPARQLRREPHILSALSDRKRELTLRHVRARFAPRKDLHAFNLRRRQRVRNEFFRIVGPFRDVDLLVAQLVVHRHHARAALTHERTHRIHTIRL